MGLVCSVLVVFWNDMWFLVIIIVFLVSLRVSCVNCLMSSIFILDLVIDCMIGISCMNIMGVSFSDILLMSRICGFVVNVCVSIIICCLFLERRVVGVLMCFFSFGNCVSIVFCFVEVCVVREMFLCMVSEGNMVCFCLMCMIL